MTGIMEIFKAYNGTGYFCLLFIAALIYLWFTEENKGLKLLLVTVPTVIQVLFFIPYFYMAYNALDEGTYYRLLWLMPMSVVIAYSAVKVIGTHLRIGSAVVCVVIILSGTYAYTGVTFSKAENAYHLPDEVIELCDMVKPVEEGRRIWVAFPPELVHFVRQYTTSIMLPFGRDSMVDSWKRLSNPLFDLYMSYEIPADSLARYATDYQCDYVIVNNEVPIVGEVGDYGLTIYGSTPNYTVYSNLDNAVWYDPEAGSFVPAMFRED